MTKILLNLAILVTFTTSVEFQIWRKYECNIAEIPAELDGPNYALPDEFEGVPFSLAITDERNIIERAFGQSTGQLNLSQESMTFTVDEIKEVLNERYGIDAGQPSEAYTISTTADFATECSGNDLVVLINKDSFIDCSVYKISKNGVETELRQNANAAQDLEAEEGYFTSVYGAVSSQKTLTKEEWIQQRFLGTVPMFVKDVENDVCHLFTLHLPNDHDENEGFIQNVADLVNFVTSVDTDGQDLQVIQKIQSEVYDFKQSVSQLDSGLNSSEKKKALQNLTTEQKLNVINMTQSSEEIANTSNLIQKLVVAQSLQINEEDTRNSQIKKYMASIGGNQLTNQLAMSQSFAFEPTQLINQHSQNSQELDRTTQSQKKLNTSNLIAQSINNSSHQLNESADQLNLIMGTQNSMNQSQKSINLLI